MLYFLWKNPLFHLRSRPAPKKVPRTATPVTPLEQLQVDALLDKIAKEGLQSLTDAERSFLTRVSERKRGRQGPA